MKQKLLKIPYYGSLALLVYMPFHIFVSQWFSTFTGGLYIWKGAKDAITFVLLLVSVALVALYGKKTPKSYWYLALAGAAYGLLHIVLYVINKDTSLNVAGLATAYNCRLFAYAIIGWSVALLTPEKLTVKRIVKIVLVVSTVVCLLGLLQYVLPKSTLTHFGYSLERGVKPAFFIDDKPDLPRIMSTLRDPNSLAAFLVIPVTLIWAYVLGNKNKDRFMMLFGLLGVHLLALFLTFSRAGLAGTFISLVVVTIYLKKDLFKIWFKRFGVPIVAIVLVLAFGAYTLRDQYFVQHVIFHSDESTVAQLDSNDLHVSFVRRGLDGIVDKPTGHGPGTAGIVSIQNPDGGLLTENYFVQIGYEVGVVGLALFAAVLFAIEKRLAMVKNNPLAAVLFAAFWGFLFMAMLAHLWTNEAVAVLWWLLAGVSIASSRNSHNKNIA
jgi:hypothetical protein